MKRFLLLAVFVVTTFVVKAQDVIILRRGDKILTKIQYIRLNDIVYSQGDSLCTLPKSDIFCFKYANRQNYRFVKEGKFQGYAYASCDFASSSSYFKTLPSKIKSCDSGAGPSFDLSFGVRLLPFLYIGGGTGWYGLTYGIYVWNSWYSGYWYYGGMMWEKGVPITVDTKLYIPTKANGFYPRFDLSIGGYVGSNAGFGYRMKLGYYMNLGAGFDYRRFSFGVGYKLYASSKYGWNIGYARLGVLFGKKSYKS